MTGTVKFFNGSKGFGFITNDETGEDIFVHVTSLDGIKIDEGDKVSYNEGEGFTLVIRYLSLIHI